MKGLILAGGSGTRLWPLSRSSYPKQFQKLGGAESFLQKTVRRNLGVIAADDLYIITAECYYHDVVSQVREIDPILVDNIILEPEPRNTAPAIALAVAHLLERDDEDDVLFISPSDHVIAPQKEFQFYLREAEKLAHGGKLVTFGIRPTRPETGYGYIKAKGSEVEHFVEKPDLKTALDYVSSGHYYWNSGMFAFSLKKIREEFEAHAPELAADYKTLHDGFAALPEISIDYAIMEKSEAVAMIPLALSWSDVGSWDNVYDLLDKDEHNNVVVGNVEALKTNNSLIYADKRLVTTIGVDDLMVVETADVVLVCKKNESQRVKDLVRNLRNAGHSEVDEHSTSFRPWGSYTVLEEGLRYKIKRITVDPLQKLSLQMHYHRSEHWVVVTGTAKVTINDQESIVHEGESIFVPKSSSHRMENPGKVPLEIIEVQVGEYLGEDDIVRFEDKYGRLKDKETFELLLSNRGEE